MSISKKEFADRIAGKRNITKKVAYQEVDAFIGTVIDFLAEGEAVKFQNFGRFEMKTAKERVGRNPKTGQSYIVPEHQKVKFTVSEKLVDRIQESRDVQ